MKERKTGKIIKEEKIRKIRARRIMGTWKWKKIEEKVLKKIKKRLRAERRRMKEWKGKKETWLWRKKEKEENELNIRIERKQEK